MPNPAAQNWQPGLTLIEVVVVLSIVAVLASLSVAGLKAIKTRNIFSATANGLAVALSKVRADSYGSGATSVFVLRQSTGQYWGIRDVNDNFDLNSFDPSNPAPSPDVLIASGTLSSPVTVGPSNGYGAAFSAPFASVPSTAACTFCLTTGTSTGYGAIRYLASGGATLSGTNVRAGSFTIQSPLDGGIGASTMTYAIVGRTGALETYEGSR